MCPVKNKSNFLHQKHVAVKYAKNVFAAGAPSASDPAGELTTLPRPTSRLRRGYPLPTHPTRRLRRLDPCAFGARHLAPRLRTVAYTP